MKIQYRLDVGGGDGVKFEGTEGDSVMAKKTIMAAVQSVLGMKA
jgi:hypothetical protein